MTYLTDAFGNLDPADNRFIFYGEFKSSAEIISGDGKIFNMKESDAIKYDLKVGEKYKFIGKPDSCRATLQKAFGDFYINALKNL